MNQTDSLTMFIQSAQLFLKNEVQIPVREEVVKYMVVNYFDEFSAAYMEYRNAPNVNSIQRIKNVLMATQAKYEAALVRARECTRNVPV